METIKPTDLQELLIGQPDLTLIDVRTPVEFNEVHAIKATNYPLNQLDRYKGEREVPIYILCRTGARAAQAAKKLVQAGFLQPVVVEGGTLAWLEAKLPVIRGEVKVISLERQVRIAAGTLVLTGVLLSIFVHPYAIGLAAFVGAGLIFAGITDTCGMALLLAKLPWNNR
jgi:rhodanese-related sulfurtransferase